MTTSINVSEAAQIIAAHDTVTALCHVNPDADAIGSAAGLGLALRAAGTAVHLSFDPGVVPDDLQAIPGSELFTPLQDVPAHGGLVVILDCASRDRVGHVEHLLESASHTLVIDHHRSNPGFGDSLLLDPRAASTATLVTEVLDDGEWNIDFTVATALYAGLVTDTGSFRWGGPGAHATALRLARAGADTEKCVFELLDAQHFSYLTFLATVLAGARLDRAAAGGAGVVWVAIDHETAHHVTAGEVESVVAHIRAIREASVAAVLKEFEPQQWSVSLRSRDNIDVSAVAEKFGGGGHPAAAGCTIDGTAAEVMEKLGAKLG